jgi:hypothetical protein
MITHLTRVLWLIDGEAASEKFLYTLPQTNGDMNTAFRRSLAVALYTAAGSPYRRHILTAFLKRAYDHTKIAVSIIERAFHRSRRS